MLRIARTVLALLVVGSTASACRSVLGLTAPEDVDAAADAQEDASARDASNSERTIEPDAATDGDAASDASGCPSACADAGGWLCDDFENGLDTAKWQVNVGFTDVAIDGTHVHRGCGALHVTTKAVSLPGGSTIEGMLEHAAPQPATIYARVFVYAAAYPNDMIVMLSQEAQGQAYGLQAGVLPLDVWDWTPPTYYGQGSPSTTSSQWHCMEWEIALSDAGAGAGTSTLWLDEALAVNTPTIAVPADLSSFDLGLRFLAPDGGAQPVFDVWFDDLIIDVQRVHCAR